MSFRRPCHTPFRKLIPPFYLHRPQSSFQSEGADPPLGLVGLWTFKMVYLVPTQYFLIQLQLINHVF